MEQVSKFIHKRPKKNFFNGVQSGGQIIMYKPDDGSSVQFHQRVNDMTPDQVKSTIQSYMNEGYLKPEYLTDDLVGKINLNQLGGYNEAPPDQWTGIWKSMWDQGYPYLIITQNMPPVGTPMFKSGSPTLSTDQKTQLKNTSPLWIKQILESAGW